MERTFDGRRVADDCEEHDAVANASVQPEQEA